MPSLQTTRASLLARIGSTPADPGAWNDFAAFYAPAILQWCRDYGLQDDDAHEVAQEVMVRFWRHAAEFRHDPSRRFRSYLRRIVLTAVADWADATKHERVAGSDPLLEALLESLPAREDLATSIERAFDLELLAEAMRDVESRVKPTTWAAFRMAAIDRVPGKEVADTLGMTMANVYIARMRVHRMISDTLRYRESAAEAE